jgi:hypothetical protein
MRSFFLPFSLLFWLCFTANAQQTWTSSHQLKWANKPQLIETSNGTTEVWLFNESSISDAFGQLPVFNHRIALPGNGSATVTLGAEQFSVLSRKTDADDQYLTETIKPEYWVEQERNQFYLRVRFVPIRKRGVQFEQAESFNLNINFTPSANFSTDRGGPLTFTSALSDGAIYQFGVTQTSVYKLDYNYLKNTLKVANLDQLDPKTIRIYGNGGAALPQRAGAPRIDDLAENAIIVVGEADGKFNQDDYILMYGEGPTTFKFEPSSASTQLTGTVNIYSKEAYYFLKVGAGQGLRIPEQASIGVAGVDTDAFDDVQRLEDEKVNLLDYYTLTQGSGQLWFGDLFGQGRTKNYSDRFDFPNAVTNAKGKIRAQFVGRSSANTTARLTVNDAVLSRNISNVNTSEIESTYARLTQFAGEFTLTNDKPTVVMDYLPGTATSEGWIDFIELQVRRKLIMDKKPLIFRDLSSLQQANTNFRLTSSQTGISIWDITDQLLPQNQGFKQTGNLIEFVANTNTQLKTFVAFAVNELPAPDVQIGPINNQNLHGIDHVDMAIVYAPEFKVEAERLAKHRRDFSGLETVTVDVVELYREFAGGKKDPSAIRDFAKMLLERDQRFKYLLLFGDGSFDPRGITDAAEIDRIPVFETFESLQPIEAHPSDDFFGLLSDNEGGDLLGAVDVAVGRLPVNTIEEANTVVNKIIAYDADPVTLGDWHNRMLYFADDEDSNVHLEQAENLSDRTKLKLSYINFEKVYLDAYEQIATSGGQRSPDCKKALNSNVFKGNLILTYIGHGGPRGWTQERVLDNNDIALWGNENRCPLIISATCSFGGYDNPRFRSGGEQSLLKQKSGAMGLFTTVRAVYISGNNRLTDAVEKVIFAKQNGKYRPIGQILVDAKNQLSSGDEDNARRFTLLGDPAQLLALPEYRVATTSINDKPYDPSKPDTLSALEPVKLTGEVRDTLGSLLSGFNGRVFITVYDKPQELQTLGTDQGSNVVPFSVQRSIIFRGAATVTNGKFSVSFIVPKDINYTSGKGKISYYAENGTPLDAAGSDSEFIVAGISDAIKDDQPPVVLVFMNDDKFVTGGTTDANPRIYAKISDDYGINVSGTSIGHDLTSVLDANVQETLVLNDFYQSNLDNAKAGVVTYPLNNIEPGVHKVTVKAWDIANNSGEGYTEFVVANDGQSALNHVLNYPNPFTTNTYFQFEHNMPGQLLDVKVRIFTVSGKLVKTLHHQTTPEGYRVTDVQWDGKDDYGDNIGKGVYVYKVSVRGTDLAGTSRNIESKFEKLVILK